MKRGGEIKRTKPLRAKTPLKAKKVLERKTPLERVQMDRLINRVNEDYQKAVKAKRPKVTPEERKARKTVQERSQGICEGCGQRPARDWAHRVGRGQGGPWCASNGLHLCNPGGCHDRAHASIEWARARGWILRSTQNPATTPALLAGKGWVYLSPDGSVTPAERGAA